MGCVWFIYRKMELRYWLVRSNTKNEGSNEGNVTEDFESLYGGQFTVNYLVIVLSADAAPQILSKLTPSIYLYGIFARPEESCQGR